jgi:hypothetical protein
MQPGFEPRGGTSLSPQGVRMGAPLLLPVCPDRGKRGSRINPPLTSNEPCWPAVHLGANRTHVSL